ncbi:hypothetical protein BS47DRAFT_1372655 [Hydnum rufescens UP504]|uniref:ABC transporter domain-containing protein n=1 Tax=Hydnum rufescens UP504 TaxID=1448309 RepID=A0A9P6DVV2_9AGAM|nr:hypothetical protein BS47DRAFT_1372655 [Hydnum rufescens UP504]
MSLIIQCFAGIAAPVFIPGKHEYEVVVQYLSGLCEDPDEEPDVVLKITKEMLQSAVRGHAQELQGLIQRLTERMQAKALTRSAHRRPTLTRLDNVVDMSKAGALSSTIGFNESVDLSSTNKGKASQVDIKKLEKAEAKIKNKIEKRARRDLYEGSKLIEMQKKQINPLESRTTAKGRSKDIHLQSIDVTFGSHRILTGASLTLAYGRRYGLIGRNGVGKSTLLRHIALREVPIPPNISILFVEQEIVGDDTLAIDSVLKERELNVRLQTLEGIEAPDKLEEIAKEEAVTRLAEVHANLADIEAESGPARAAQLLSGLGFGEEDQRRPTRTFSGGWRMRLALARALFVKPDLLMLGKSRPRSRDYLQTWQGTILVVSHDRAFLDAVATDIIYQHSNRLDYFKGNFAQFYANVIPQATKTERERNQRKEYQTQMEYRAHLQAFIDRWRYNANRAAQAQMKIKILEKLPELEMPEAEETEKFRFPETEKISPPLLQLNEVTFGYTPDKIILKGVNIDVGLDSPGKSTLIKLLIGELKPVAGHLNAQRKITSVSCSLQAYFAQHHVDTLTPTMSPVGFLASRFPGKSEQEYRQHLGHSGSQALPGKIMQVISTLSGGQKSRVAFAALSLQMPHILLLDRAGLDALMHALQVWNGGVILISHDERFITKVASELWVCGEGTVKKYYGDVKAYKQLIVANIKGKP